MSENEEPFAASDRLSSWELGFYILYFGAGYFLIALVGLFSDPLALRSRDLSSYLSLSVREAMNILLVLYLMWRTGRPWDSFGLRRCPALTFLWAAIALALAHYAGAFLLNRPLRDGLVYNAMDRPPWLGPQTFGAPPPLAFGIPVILTYVVLSAAFQEFAFRGLLLSRLTEYLESPSKAAIGSSIIFTLLHAYQGLASLPEHFLFGWVACLLVQKTRSVWPLVAAHFVVNALLYLRPYLMMGMATSR